jgi:hypothetical protein
MKKNIRLLNVLLIVLIYAIAFLMSQCGKKMEECPTFTTTSTTTTTTTTVPQVAAITFRPAPGTYEANSLVITAESTTEGASIYFTFNGAAAGASGVSTNHTTIYRSGTVEAMAIKAGQPNSDAASGNYELWWWQATGTGLEGYGEVQVSAMVFDSAGILYAGGGFKGVTSEDHIIRLENSTWSAVAGGLVNGDPYSLVVDNAGDLYVGGEFTSAEGVAGTGYIAKWDVGDSTWEALGGGMNPYSSVQTLAYDADNDLLYAGGYFSTASGVDHTANIARWDPDGDGTWEALGGGMNGEVRALAYDADNDLLYAGGSFSTASGVDDTAYLARWNVSGQTWEAMGKSFDSSVSYLVVDESSGDIYAYSNGYVWYWDGSWSNIGPWGFVESDIESMAYDSANGLLYVGGMFFEDYSSNMLCVLRWNGTSWEEINAYAIGEAEIETMVIDSSGIPYVGGEEMSALSGVPGVGVWHWGKKE